MEKNLSAPRRARALTWLLLLLVCAGCEVRLRTEVVLDRDGAGRLALSLAADREAQERAAAAGAAPLDALEASGEELADEGWRTSSTVAGDGGRVVHLETDFADPADLERLTGQLAETLGGAEGRLLEPFTLTVEADTLALTAGAAVQPTDAALAEAGLDRPTALVLLRDGFSSEVVVEMPGEIQAAPGAALGPQGLTATYALTGGEEVAIEVTAHRPPRFSLAELALAGAVALALAVGVAAVLRRRGPLVLGRRRGESPLVGADEVPGAPPGRRPRRRRTRRPPAAPE